MYLYMGAVHGGRVRQAMETRMEVAVLECCYKLCKQWADSLLLMQLDCENESVALITWFPGIRLI